MFVEKRRILKKFVVIMISAILVLSLAACGSDSSDNGLIKMKLGYLPVMDDAPTILAYRAGLYEKHGIDAEMQMFTSGTELIKQIVGENLDAGVLGFSNAFSWIDKDYDLKIVGGAQMGFHSMLVREDSGIDNVDQLKGKVVASQKIGSTADIILNGVIWENAGLAREDVTMQYVSPAVAIQALEAGTVDGAFVFEPFSAIAKLSYPVKEIYEIGQEWPFPCMVVITSGDNVKNNRDAVNKMLDAQKEAIEMLQNEPAKAAAYITKDFIQEETITKLDGTTVPAVDVIQASIESQEFTWAITDQDIERMTDVAQMLVDQQITDSVVDVNSALDLTWQEQFK